MKKSLCCFLLMLMLILCACTISEEEKHLDAWLKKAELNESATADELYARALNEGTLKIYSNTTRTYDTQAAFEKAYPGINIDVQFVRAADLIDLLEEQSSIENPICDIVICSDNEGIISTKYVNEGLLHKYVPSDIEKYIYPEYRDKMLNFMVEGGILFYNNEVYDSPPISNWWELTEPRFKGKLYMVDPLRSHTTNALMVSMIQHSDEMEAAYSELYGKALDIPEGSSAGQEFWRMLIPNISYTSSSDEALELVGMPGQSEPPMAILVSSKERKADLGYAIAPIYNIAPACGIITPGGIMIHGGAENISGAKLFIHFLMGGEDGSGEGFKPYLKEGSWSARSDVKSASSIQLADVRFWLPDGTFMAENQQWISEFWSELRRNTGEQQP